MAMLNFVFIATAFFLVTCKAAPTQDGDAKLELPPECQGKAFCPVKPKGYENLEEAMNKVLPKSLTQDYGDRISDNQMYPPRLSPKEDWDNCPTWTQNEQMFTYSFGGNNSKTEIIVQIDIFKQYVETVTCAKEHINEEFLGVEECFRGLNMGLSKGQFDMKTTCEPTYAKRTLYVFDLEKGKIYPKPFDVPVCCSCRTSDGD